MKARVWYPDGSSGPGRLEEVELPVLGLEERTIALPGLKVTEVGTDVVFEADDLRFEPSAGGGPFADPAARRQARAFGVVNVAFHLHRGLARIAALLGRPLPPLVARIGVHADQQRHWAGGHYRLPAVRYTSLPETEPPARTGEIHLGPGGGFIRSRDALYFAAPTHNAAIVCHELGHHLCRHSADFRLNRRRPLQAQANRKVPLDEGTSDYLAGVLLGTPDIYGWHRAETPIFHQARRRLDVPWTMAAFRGSSRNDPHADGIVWAAALWSARAAVENSGARGEAFDTVLLHGLVRLGESDPEAPTGEALRRRRQFSQALQSILDAEEDRGGAFRDVIERAFAGHGILVGYSNRELRKRCREALRQELEIDLSRWTSARAVT